MASGRLAARSLPRRCLRSGFVEEGGGFGGGPRVLVEASVVHQTVGALHIERTAAAPPALIHTLMRTHPLSALALLLVLAGGAAAHVTAHGATHSGSWLAHG